MFLLIKAHFSKVPQEIASFHKFRNEGEIVLAYDFPCVPEFNNIGVFEAFQGPNFPL